MFTHDAASAGSPGGCSARAPCGGGVLSEDVGQRGQDLHRIADDSVGGEIKDRRIGILVDRDDDVGTLHADAMLNRPRDAGCDVELGAYRLAGLPHLAVSGYPAGLDQRTRRANLGAEYLGKIPDQLKILEALQAASAGDDDVCIGELRLVLALVGYVFQDLGDDGLFYQAERLFDDSPGAWAAAL